EAAARLAERLRAHAAPAAAAAEPAEGPALALAPQVRAVLTEYEEHRLRAAARRGLAVHRIEVAFDLASFDGELSALNGRLKKLGEVVSTLPSADVRDPQGIAFVLLFASKEPLEAIRREAGPAAVVEVVPRVAGGEPARPPEAPAPAEEPPSLRSASQAVRVDIRKLDRLMTIVGELVLVKSTLHALAERHKAQGGDAALGAELHRADRALERRLAELQAGILEVRMVPLEQVFDKLARMVRKLAREVGKEIELQVTGGDVGLDKLIVEDLSDPLMHLVRNAIDHGVEAPDARARAGKPRAGRVRLAAAQQGSHVQIVVEDDGAGMDEDRIREVAVQRGLATPEELRELSRREVMNLIFLPGFSTARQVTSLSGRGVGMDVVKNNVAALSGIIEIQTQRGRGTRFEITLPVTLAIVRALVVEVAGRTYVVPLGSVVEILEVRACEVRTLSTREVISIRGATVPLVRLGRFFALQGGRAPDPFFAVVVGLAQQRLGIAVDAVVGQQDVVVKPLGPALRGVRGVAGATDLGNGRTVLVLDVGAIIEEALEGEGLGGDGPGVASPAEGPARRAPG
ncbi:chemotaxis protein CheA, partial [Anaeromyxobacter oryzisoli]|uniref:chemotaxis protein CheA n=1 Tax=Anaeromyxobacter oryzisoli TaxID=2925408 RepID=UPI001F586A9D